MKSQDQAFDAAFRTAYRESLLQEEAALASLPHPRPSRWAMVRMHHCDWTPEELEHFRSGCEHCARLAERSGISLIIATTPATAPLTATEKEVLAERLADWLGGAYGERRGALLRAITLLQTCAPRYQYLLRQALGNLVSHTIERSAPAGETIRRAARLITGFACADTPITGPIGFSTSGIPSGSKGEQIAITLPLEAETPESEKITFQRYQWSGGSADRLAIFVEHGDAPRIMEAAILDPRDDTVQSRTFLVMVPHRPRSRADMSLDSRLLHNGCLCVMPLDVEFLTELDAEILRRDYAASQNPDAAASSRSNWQRWAAATLGERPHLDPTVKKALEYIVNN